MEPPSAAFRILAALLELMPKRCCAGTCPWGSQGACRRISVRVRLVAEGSVETEARPEARARGEDFKGGIGNIGIHMKAYEGLVPAMVCGGKARDFFGEYMAGGMLVLLGMNSQFEGLLVGGYLGTGMHGGVIYVRGEVEPWQTGKEVGVFEASAEDLAELKPVLEEYCAALGMDCAEVLSKPFTKLVPVSHRPYGKLYAY
ncbi:MAG: hypothetical protein C0418_00445 [Coriobacteriaceae bacterium]|nr:hypothetical protein [Coriobacteriaceae bacterium]